MNYSVYEGYYDNQNEGNPSVVAHIPSDIVNDNVVKLFVVAAIIREETIAREIPMDSLRKLYPKESKSALINLSIKSFYQVSIDEKVQEIDWLFHYDHRHKQKGYVAYLDLSELNRGTHLITISSKGRNPKFPYAKIPFYKTTDQIQ